MARSLQEMGFKLHATKGTARYLRDEADIDVETFAIALQKSRVQMPWT